MKKVLSLVRDTNNISAICEIPLYIFEFYLKNL